MPSHQIMLRTRRPVDYGTTAGTNTINRRGKELLRQVAKVVQGALGGAEGDAELALGYSATDPSVSAAALVMSGGAGAVGAIINGVTVTATFATSDTNSCALAAAAINSSVNALVHGFVSSSNLSATLTLASAVAGNQVQVGSTIFTAVSGTPGLGQFDISGGNGPAATSLAAAINACPVAQRFFVAIANTAVAGQVRIFARQFTYDATANTFAFPVGPGAVPNTITSQATTITASSNGVVASALFSLVSLLPGIQGNAITVALSGTGVTVLNTATRLVGGTGPVTFIATGA